MFKCATHRLSFIALRLTLLEIYRRQAEFPTASPRNPDHSQTQKFDKGGHESVFTCVN